MFPDLGAGAEERVMSWNSDLDEDAFTDSHDWVTEGRGFEFDGWSQSVQTISSHFQNHADNWPWSFGLLFFFLLLLYGSETRNKSKHVKLLKVTCVGFIQPCSVITVPPKVQPGKQMRPDMSKSALNQATLKGASFFTPYTREWYILFHSFPIAYTPFLMRSHFLPVLGCLDFINSKWLESCFE